MFFANVIEGLAAWSYDLVHLLISEHLALQLSRIDGDLTVIFESQPRGLVTLPLSVAIRIHGVSKLTTIERPCCYVLRLGIE